MSWFRETRETSSTTSLVETRLVVDDDGHCSHLGPCLPDRFLLQRFLGCGSMGRVYLAHDGHLGREVAVKVLDRGGAQVFERFRREARIAAMLENPSIVRVFEIDECGGRPYIVMEYVAGGNLADVELGHLALVRAIRDVADALQHVHERGIVHRDIKPENILLDQAGRARLADFGLARDLTGRSGETLSDEGQITGTPWCMAPEQARGLVDAIDHRTDLHALGATFYARLAGRRPFTGDSVVDVLHAVIHDEPAPLDAATPRTLARIVMRCLRKDKQERPTAAEVVAELDRYLAGIEPPGRFSSWWRELATRVVRPSSRQPREAVADRVHANGP